MVLFLRRIAKTECLPAPMGFSGMLEGLRDGPMPTEGFNWDQIDHALVNLKLQSLSAAMWEKIGADETTIRHENRQNLNASTVPYLLVQIRERRTDEWALKKYTIYCDTWKQQGHDKTPEFVRAVRDRAIKPFIRQRLLSIRSKMEEEARQTNSPPEHLKVQLEAVRLSMLRLEDRWTRSLEMEAKELEHGSGNAAGGPRNPKPRAEAPKRRVSRPKPQCFIEAARLLRLRGNKGLGVVDFCRLMDSKAEQYPTTEKYKPPASWDVRTFYEKYLQRPNTVSRFLSAVRKHVKDTAE
jgi:hypothetical protein